MQLESTSFINDNQVSVSGYSQNMNYIAQPRREHSPYFADDQKSVTYQGVIGGVFPVVMQYDDNEHHVKGEQMVGDFRAKPHFRRPDCQKKLLALIRKQGMDILFPMNTHDKVLSCIFVALRWNVALAHKELIDLVMLVKDSKKVTQLDSVTKTKIRGLLSLLKNAEVLTTHGLEGTPVLLALHPSVQSFEDLRACHDNFIHLFALQSFSQFSVDQLHEILWPLDPDLRSQRAAAIAEFSRQLVEFLKETVQPPSDPLSMASVLTFDNAVSASSTALQQHHLDQIKLLQQNNLVSVPVPAPASTTLTHIPVPAPAPVTTVLSNSSAGALAEGKIAKQASIDQFFDLGMYVSESGSWSSDRADGFVDMLHATMEEENVFADRMSLGENPLSQPTEFKCQSEDSPTVNVNAGQGASGNSNSNRVASARRQFPNDVAYESHHQSFHHQNRTANNSRQLHSNSSAGIISNGEHHYLQFQGQSQGQSQGHRTMDLTHYRNLGTVPAARATSGYSSLSSPHPYEQQQQQQQYQGTGLGLLHPSPSQSHHPHRYHSSSLSTMRQSPAGSLFDRQQHLHLQQGRGKSFSYGGYGGGGGGGGQSGLSNRTMSMMRPNKDIELAAAQIRGVGGGLAGSGGGGAAAAYPPRHNGAPNSPSFSPGGFFPPNQLQHQNQHQLQQPSLLVRRGVPPSANHYFDLGAADSGMAPPSLSPSGRTNGIGFSSSTRWQAGGGGGGAYAGESSSSPYYDLEEPDGILNQQYHHPHPSVLDGDDSYGLSSHSFDDGRRTMSAASYQQQQQQQQQQPLHVTDGHRRRPVPRLAIPEGREGLYDPNLLRSLNVSNFLNAASPNSVSGRSSFLMQEEMKEKLSKEQASFSRVSPLSYPAAPGPPPPPLPSWFFGNTQTQAQAQAQGNITASGSGIGVDNQSFFSEDPRQAVECILEGYSKEMEGKATVGGAGAGAGADADEKTSWYSASEAESSSA